MLFVTIFLFKKDLFSEGLNETFLALAQIIETVYQYSAKWDQPKKKNDINPGILYVVCDIFSNILFSESLIETFPALAQIIETIYQYSAKWDQQKKKEKEKID